MVEIDYNNVVSDVIVGYQPSLFCGNAVEAGKGKLRLLSLFSGCGGMDIGFEGGFICHKKSVQSDWVLRPVNDDWVQVRSTMFDTVFANDILEEARKTWVGYMSCRKNEAHEIFHFGSIVDYVKRSQDGNNVFPDNIDIVIGGFPCQDFSVAGKRKGFDSNRDHNGKLRDIEVPSEETRGKLYFWMKQVIEITRPKMFIAENVKGLVNLGDVKDIIQQDFSSADENGYIVLPPKVLQAANYGVPESRERVIFIGVRKDALNDTALKALSMDIVPDEYNPYPKKTHSYKLDEKGLLPTVTCEDVLCGLKEPDETQDPSQKFYSRAKFMGAHCQGQTEIQLNGVGPTIRSEHHGNIEYRRLSEEHGGQNLAELNAGLKERRLTPRECALIQTFPPDYTFVRYKGYSKVGYEVSPSGAYKVIGNAVPPVLAYNIANRLQELWPKYFD